jgi:hypothetical protein
MRIPTCATLSTLLFLLPSPGVAGTLEQAIFSGQVQMQLDQGQIVSCGVRLTGATTTASQQLLGFDASVNVAKPAFGMVKGLAYQGTLEQYAKGDLSRLQLQTFWFRKPDGLTTVPQNGQYLESPETARAILYPTSVDSAFGILDAVLKRQDVQIGFRLVDDPDGRIFFGVVELAHPEMMQLAQCLKDWAGSTLEQVETQKPKIKQK